ncbi:MAG: hypothetical protein ACR2OM_04305, partial [Aestuariivirgaceae bacterium]
MANLSLLADFGGCQCSAGKLIRTAFVRQGIEGTVDESAFGVIEEGAGQLDIFSEDNPARYIGAVSQFVA